MHALGGFRYGMYGDVCIICICTGALARCVCVCACVYQEFSGTFTYI